MEFRSALGRVGWLGLAGAAGLFGLAVILSIELGQRPALWLSYVLAIISLFDLAALAVVLCRTLADLRLRYRLDRNGLIVVWGATRLVVPMAAIQTIVPAKQLTDLSEASWNGHRWWRWGTRLGHVRLPDGREAYLGSNLPLADSLAVITSRNIYVVSPEQPEAFIQAWQTRRPLGATQHWHEQQQRTGLLGLPVWYDRVAWGLLLGTLGAVLVLNGYLCAVYDHLPLTLAFHFDVLGRLDRSGPRAGLFVLPLLAGAMMVLDVGLGFLVYRRERMAAYLVWGGALILQLLTLGAVYTITG